MFYLVKDGGVGEHQWNIKLKNLPNHLYVRYQSSDLLMASAKLTDGSLIICSKHESQKLSIVWQSLLSNLPSCLSSLGSFLRARTIILSGYILSSYGLIFFSMSSSLSLSYFLASQSKSSGNHGSTVGV